MISEISGPPTLFPLPLRFSHHDPWHWERWVGDKLIDQQKGQQQDGPGMFSPDGLHIQEIFNV